MTFFFGLESGNNFRVRKQNTSDPIPFIMKLQVDNINTSGFNDGRIIHSFNTLTDSFGRAFNKI